MRFLTFVGRRRPATLETQAEYSETISRPKAEPVLHDESPDVLGEHQGAGPGRAVIGRHRA